MMRISLVVAAVGVAFGAVAHAATPVSSFAVGFGLEVGRMNWTGPEDRYYGHGGTVDISDMSFGPTLTLGTFLGAELAPPVAVGLGLELALQLDNGADLSFTDFGPQYNVAATAHLVYRPHAGSLVWRFDLGAAMSGFAGGGVGVGSPDNVVEFERVFGPVAEASLGWYTSSHAGWAIALRAEYLWAEHLSYAPVLLSLRVQLGAY